jgi:hypothetical protein
MEHALTQMARRAIVVAILGRVLLALPNNHQKHPAEAMPVRTSG